MLPDDVSSASFFNIDRDRLDVAWLNQPALYFDYAIKLADARREHDEAKATLDVVKAELDMKIRTAPERYNVAKVTETAVAAAILQHRSYQTALEEVGEAKHTMDVYAATTAALEHRKAALQALVQLHGQNYFAKPTGKPEDIQAVKDAQRNRRKQPGYNPKKKRGTE